MKRTTTTGGTRRAIGYVRVSTDGQATEGVSLAAQREAIERYAESAGLELVTIETDAGISGKRMDTRPGLARAVDRACTEGGVLLVYSLSRLARSTRDTLDVAAKLEAARADLVSLSEKIDTTGACGRMVFRMLAVLAEFERETIAERTRAALRHKRSIGEKCGGQTPYGFTVDRQSGRARLVPCIEEQRTIEQVRQLRADGLSLRGIADELTNRGVKPRSGGRWHPKVVRSMAEAELLA